MKESRNIIFLYAELTPYLMGCIDYFLLKNPSTKIFIVYDRVFSNLKIKNKLNCELIKRERFKNKKHLFEFCLELNPAILLVSGRMFKSYLYVCKKMKNKSIRITVQDTIYKKSFKQIVIKNLSVFLYHRYFDKFWGIGKLQKKFALDIGFNEKDILTGFYVADRKFFKNSNIFTFNNNNLNILFIGRLVKEKNILKLIDTIEEINSETESNHKISIIGDGYLLNQVKKRKSVNYLGLKTQDEIINIALNCDVFCLPSIYEPWGVVTHEMAAIGLPIVASNLCGSSHDLVLDGFNGFNFDPFSAFSIKTAFNDFISLSNEEKSKLSYNSIKISKKINHDNWNNNIISLLN